MFGFWVFGMEGLKWNDADMIRAVSIGHRAEPNDAYRLIIGR